MPAKKRARLLRRATPKKLIPPFRRDVRDDIVRLPEQGACPMCNFPLKKCTVRVSGEPVLKFWKCTSEHCSLMFWRKPKRREVIKEY